MNDRRFRPFLSFLVAATVAGALGACGQKPAEEPPLAGARLGGDFSLVDQDGKPANDARFAGKYRIVYFGYTFCPDVCPVDMATIAAGLSAFEREDKARAAKVQPIFVTVDPARDTPAALKQFVTALHPRLIGLTGSEAQVAAAEKAFGVYSIKQGDAGAENYLVDHSRVALLFGPDGKPIAIVPHDKGARGVTEELERWVT